MKFKTLGKQKDVDILKEISTFLNSNPKGRIYISTDSQAKGEKIKYATVIVLHTVDETLQGRGARVFYKTNYDPRNLFGKSSGKDFAKLYKETELSIEVANYIRDTLNITVNFIELDYNADPNYFSNSVLLAALGYVKGSGYVPRGKPALAAYAADKIAKK